MLQVVDLDIGISLEVNTKSVEGHSYWVVSSGLALTSGNKWFAVSPQYLKYSYY